MEIIVLIKQVPDLSIGKVELKKDGTLEREKAGKCMNPYDRHAIEAALQLKEQLGGRVRVLSMGLPQAEEVLREALAMGADEAYLLTDRKLAASDTLATAYALSKAIEKMAPFDLVLCGLQSTDGDTAQVGPQVAERLKIPQLTYVEYCQISDGFMKVKRIREGGYEICECPIPLLMTISPTANQPRYASLSKTLWAKRQQIYCWDISHIDAEEEKVGKKGSPTLVKKTEKPRVKLGQCELIGTAMSMDDMLQRLQERGIL